MTTEHQRLPLETLLDEVSSALADLAQAAQDGQMNGAEISATLVEMRELMAQRQDAAHPLAGLVEAVKALRLDVAAPQVTVQNHVKVLPTPIQNTVHTAAPVVHVLERAAPVDYEMKVTYDAHGRIEAARLLALLPKTQRPPPTKTKATA